MFLYLLLIRKNRDDLKAAIDLFANECGAQSRGIAPAEMGFVFATENQISNEIQEILGIVPFE